MEDSEAKVVLFFGCRGKSRDFYFENEWEKCSQKFKGFQLITAFSRDQEDKIYVQHKMLSEEFLIKEILYLSQGNFYIAGNAKQMPDLVHKIIFNFKSKTFFTKKY